MPTFVFADAPPVRVKDETAPSAGLAFRSGVGPRGPVGPQGDPGVDGLDGADGAQGAPGADGATGPQGSIGPQGIQGLKGDAGTNGSDGIAGAQGPAGPVGPAGADGPVGPAGPTGSVGPSGSDGPTGPQGPAGPKGDTGLTGAAGADGAAGPQGIQGLKGDTGLTGAAGADGAAGPQGIQGLKGDPGATGAIGPQGIQGLTGPAGPAGATGATGPGFVFRGAWSSSTAYVANDVVTRGFDQYLATVPSTGVDPTVTGAYVLKSGQTNGGTENGGGGTNAGIAVFLAFTPTTTFVADSVRIYRSQTDATGPVHTVGIATSIGAGSANIVWLSKNTTASLALAGYNQVAIPSVTLQAGTTYYIIQQTFGGADAYQYGSSGSSGPSMSGASYVQHGYGFPGNSWNLYTAGNGYVPAFDVGSTGAAWTLFLTGAKPDAFASKTAAYTALAGEFVKADASAAAFTVTLPTAPALGSAVTVKKVDSSANGVRVAGAGATTIDGAASTTLAGRWTSATFEYDGSNWLIKSMYAPVV